MTNSDLGKLEPVDLRDVWPNEAENFTPWLAQQENLDELGSTLGLDLQYQDTEQSVGPYSVDILCTDTSDNSHVVIENQLEATDHTHLGQILTYAAHFNASTLVWVAQSFDDQHRAAVDWLNEHFAEQTGFFGLEIELWKIGDSSPAPKFNVVAKPNNWTRVGRMQSTVMSDAGRLQLEFWQGFRDYVGENGRRVSLTSNPRPGSYIAAGRVAEPGFLLRAIASMWSETAGYSTQDLRVDLTINHGEQSEEYFEDLMARREDIERAFGEELNWLNPDKSQACRISIRKEVNLYDLDGRTAQYEWLLNRMERFQQVLAEPIRAVYRQTGL